MENGKEADAAARRVAAARQSCVARFGRVAERLSDVHGSAVALTAQAADLRGLLETGRLDMDPLAGVRDAVSALQEAVRRGQLTTLDETSLTRARTALEILLREARRLAVVATQTRVTAESLRVGTLAEYIEGLHRLRQTLRQDATGLAEGLEAVVAAHRRLGRATQHASEALDRARRDLSTEAGVVAALEVKDARAAVVTLEDALRIATGSETRGLIEAIQFCDAMSQRLQHVEAMLGAARGRERAVAALAAAQLRALAEDAEAVCGAADGSLARLASVAGEARSTLLAQAGDGGLARLLRQQRDSIDLAAACESTLSPALAEAAAAAVEIEERLQEAVRLFANLGTSATMINLSAINATLLLSQSASVRAPLAVLAGSVRESAHNCACGSDMCRRAMETLSCGLDPSAFADFDTALVGYREAVADCTAQVTAAEAAERRLAQIRAAVAGAAESLVATAGQARDALAAVVPELTALSAIVAHDGEAPVDAGALRDLAGLYTMQRERDVHAVLCGEAVAGPEATQPADADDLLAGILF